ncbi:hypothetical protein Mbo2_102 [Rhodococcus phage Mbo2]|uniref:Uncharacterized protein n=1 Tax=Rhodococcus phage Mbo2 TaxID=2936911 RepID=A0A9E7L9Y6_9CAUD|nr:hypothetical protein Mbo2_102 [Rhodococcus phage Mbo2]
MNATQATYARITRRALENALTAAGWTHTDGRHVGVRGGIDTWTAPRRPGDVTKYRDMIQTFRNSRGQLTGAYLHTSLGDRFDFGGVLVGRAITDFLAGVRWRVTTHAAPYPYGRPCEGGSITFPTRYAAERHARAIGRDRSVSLCRVTPDGETGTISAV